MFSLVCGSDAVIWIVSFVVTVRAGSSSPSGAVSNRLFSVIASSSFRWCVAILGVSVFFRRPWMVSLAVQVLVVSSTFFGLKGSIARLVPVVIDFII